MSNNLGLSQFEYDTMSSLCNKWIDMTQQTSRDFIKDSTFVSVKEIGPEQSLLTQTNLSENLDLKVEIKFLKTHPNAKLPTKAYSDLDNCWDLYCCETTTIPGSRCNSDGSFVLGSNIVPVGLQVAYVTPGFGFATKQKSGLAFKHYILPVAGEMDSNYRGDFAVKLINLSDKPYTFNSGDKITQFKVEKIWNTEISFANEIVPTDCDRGERGFGSSGK